MIKAAEKQGVPPDAAYAIGALEQALEFRRDLDRIQDPANLTKGERAALAAYASGERPKLTKATLALLRRKLLADDTRITDEGMATGRKILAEKASRPAKRARPRATSSFRR